MIRLGFVLVLVVGLSACSSRFLVGSLDLGGSTDLAGADQASADCATAVSGGSCSPEGRYCGGGCTDPCQFCHELTCQGGKWEDVEAFPDPNCGKDMSVGSGGFLSWQSPGGVAGWGAALTVSDDGTIRLWQMVGGFAPTGAPSSNPDATLNTSTAAYLDLMSRWSSTNTAALPHEGFATECYPVVYARTCASCTPAMISYNRAAQLLPEMDNVWKWFDNQLSNVDSTYNPRSYCNF